MSMVYLISENGKLTYSNEKLVFYNHDAEPVSIFPHLVEAITVCGVVNISALALRLLFKKEIPVYFLSRNGKYVGELMCGESKNVFIRNTQHVMIWNDTWRLAVVKSIVCGKIKNQIRFLKRHSAKQIDHEIKSLSQIEKKVEKTESEDIARGFEGIAARKYFEALSHVFPEWCNFQGRNRNPPEDEVNAVLSFVYTLLSYRVECAVISTGLDPAVGLLHMFSYGRKSLVFDLIEEFRSPIADSVVCSLFNLKILQQEDFFKCRNENNEDDCDDECMQSIDKNRFFIKITDSGIRKIIARFEAKMTDVVHISGCKSAFTYESLIKKQVRSFRDSVMGRTVYKPVFLR